MQNLSIPYIALPIAKQMIKIRLVVHENSLFIGRPLKIIIITIKIKKKTSTKYIARRAACWASGRAKLQQLRPIKWQPQLELQLKKF